MKAPPVAWDFVCKPKKAGGLGIINCGISNVAAIAKHLWFIATEKICLWVKWVHGIYLRGQNIWTVPSKENVAGYWRKILKIRDKMANGYNHNQWSGSTTGDYTISSGYKWLMGPIPNTPLAKIIWCRFTMPRHAFCLWRLTLKRLPTKDRLTKMGVSLRHKDCELCLCNEETHQHIFFECSYSQCVLQNVFSNLGFRTGLYRVEDVLMAPAYC